MTYVFDETISYNTVSAFIEAIEACDHDENTIYFTSEGGNKSATLVIVDFINKNHQAFEIVTTGELHSMAFWLCCQAKCKKRVLDDTWSAVHISSWAIDTRPLRNNNSVDSFMVKEQEKSVNKELEIYFNILTNKEFELVKEGREAFLNDDRLRAIFNAV